MWNLVGDSLESINYDDLFSNTTYVDGNKFSDALSNYSVLAGGGCAADQADIAVKTVRTIVVRKGSYSRDRPSTTPSLISLYSPYISSTTIHPVTITGTTSILLKNRLFPYIPHYHTPTITIPRIAFIQTRAPIHPPQCCMVPRHEVVWVLFHRKTIRPETS